MSESLDGDKISFTDGQLYYDGVPMTVKPPISDREKIDRVIGLCVRYRMAEIEAVPLEELLSQIEMSIDQVDIFITNIGKAAREVSEGHPAFIPPITEERTPVPNPSFQLLDEEGESRWCPGCQKYRLCDLQDECTECGSST